MATGAYKNMKEIKNQGTRSKKTKIIIVTLLGQIGLIIFLCFIIMNDKDRFSSPTITNPITDEPTIFETVEPESTAKIRETLAPTIEPTIEPKPTVYYEDISLSFAGDILLADDQRPMLTYNSRNKGISGIFSNDVIKQMNEADIFMLNNEFAFSTRGLKTPNKSYTFRSDPKNVSIFQEMGVDIVSLANNHALDFGVDALLDTFDTLDEAGINYVGAGVNLERAKQVIYKAVGGRTIAYIGAAKTIFADSWVATDSRTGMFSCWYADLLKETIETAKKQSDYVVVYLHWGVEQSNYPEEYQKEWAREYIDAGADLVLGCHSHVVQGFEYYKGKPIIYSLGNFWFSSYKRESMMINVKILSDGTIETYVVPCMTGDCYTYVLEGEEAQNYYKKLEEFSFGVTINEKGQLLDQ